MDKQLIVVSRKWHEPMIRVDVTEVGIGVTMTLEDFVLALEQEAGCGRLLAAAERVIAGMKRETGKVM
jgi:hypothetical protein